MLCCFFFCLRFFPFGLALGRAHLGNGLVRIWGETLGFVAQLDPCVFCLFDGPCFIPKVNASRCSPWEDAECVLLVFVYYILQ